MKIGKYIYLCHFQTCFASPFFPFLMLFFKTCDSQDIPNCQKIEYANPPRMSWHVPDEVAYVCIHGCNSTSIWAVWSDVELIVMTKPEKRVEFINGKGCKEVIEKHSNTSSWSPYLYFWFSANNDGKTSLMVSPYGVNCFAVIANDSPLILKVIVHQVRLLYPIMMILGVLLFLNAEDISRNVFFYYTSGISIGMILSVLLLVFIISRIIPKRSVGYAFLVCGWSLSAYFLQFVKNQFTSKTFDDNKIIYSYFIITGLISFLYCYYRGPITSERGFDIMRWCLQGVALFLVYYSIRCDKISLTAVLILVATRWISFQGIVSYMLTRGWIPYRLQVFLFKPRLITIEEYERQGQEETSRALNELREYCRSPDCNTWKTVSRLKSPKRFASFVSNGTHITEEELKEYDDTSFDFYSFFTSDEDSEPELTSESVY